MTDLWNDIVSGNFARKVKAEKRARREGRKAQAKSIQRSLGQEVKMIPSPWRAVAIILPIHEVHCSCGHVSIAPAGPRFVRFQNVRDKSLQEVPNHPDLANTNLPQKREYIRLQVDACEVCFISDEEPNPQFDLFTIYVPPTTQQSLPRDESPVMANAGERNFSTSVQYEQIKHQTTDLVVRSET